MDNNFESTPLTLEELRGMDGKPVFLPETNCCALVTKDVFVMLLTFPDGEKCSANDWYKQVGPVYAYFPAHIDREAWVCELCKGAAHVSGTAYSETPVDKDHVLSVSFSDEGADCDFDYCPKCGRPLTPEAWAKMEKRLRG